MTTKILWLNYHEATDIQLKQLEQKFGTIEVVKKSVSVTNAAEVVSLREEVGATEMVVVLPEDILADLTNPQINSGSKPIRAVMNRGVEGEYITFTHSHFERVEKIEVVTSPL